MAVKVNPNFYRKLKKFGGQSATQCFHCGNCTVVCPLSTEDYQFPRRFMRYVQLGMEEKIKHSIEPWLCYYCGDCQRLCPRQANPGEVMMALRRYLTTKYDWTGIGRLLYTSNLFKLFAVGLLFFITLWVVYTFHGPVVTEHVQLETFAPAHIVHPVGYIFGTLLAVLLLSNVYRMYKFILGPEKISLPASVYLEELKTLLLHFFTQLRLRMCTDKSRWIKHWLLMSGYFIAFMLVNVDIITRWSLTNEPPAWWHPAKLLWTYATFAMLYATTEAIIGRLRKKEPIHQFSHSTDWMFLLLLWPTIFTGLLLRIFMEADMALPAYYAFAFHLAFTVPLLGLEVPFAKWSHLAYRPFALYFIRLRERARAMQQPQAVTGAEAQSA
ncbi:4Fe-4S ferredoxin iron-sulfur binding domain-containing protein [Ammonifex degensii KC4]|uniref:4Fe-4S ferredoxin iron-sulfur binding domain-containing protein n=1 Tax=Ammonifex degensii (strain DSM 10501 / KC4) TaxID=429009 RepID=C9RD77_AMMDK|nr:4Fe-4S dicluster domain-containing protein [Ammonifex degensii]ACX52204.1 4Fe-4S ferredoxin iron-sulfur binding domain-containing protein [Ammonifex degensii KC4]